MPAGWDLTSAVCDNGEAPDSVDVGTRRDRHLRVHQHEARPHHRRQGHAPRRRSAELHVQHHGRQLRRLQPDRRRRPERLRKPRARHATRSPSRSRPAGISRARSATTASRSTRSTVGPGETVTCTFTNTKRGHIIVDKVTLPGGDPQSFTFNTTGAGYADFSLTDAAAPNDSGRSSPAPTRSPSRPRLAGISRARSVTTARRPTASTSDPARPSPACSPTRSAARSSSRSRPAPTGPTTSSPSPVTRAGTIARRRHDRRRQPRARHLHVHRGRPDAGLRPDADHLRRHQLAAATSAS